jgi:hypothetical protein
LDLRDLNYFWINGRQGSREAGRHGGKEKASSKALTGEALRALRRAGE